MTAHEHQGADTVIGPDLILMLLNAPTQVTTARDQLRGITRLEKLLFIAEQEYDVSSAVKDAFEFKPYHYGPYSKAVYESVELLEEAGLLQETKYLEGKSLDEAEEIATAAVDQEEGIERRFSLTDNGVAVAKLLNDRHAEISEIFSKIKDAFAGMSLNALIRYVYSQYPEPWTQQSKIREQVF